VGFDVLTAVVMMCSVFRDVLLYSPLKVILRFRGTYSSVGSKNKPRKELETLMHMRCQEIHK
jgi:hypothetical protein